MVQSKVPQSQHWQQYADKYPHSLIRLLQFSYRSCIFSFMGWQDRRIGRDVFFRVGAKTVMAGAGALTLASKIDVGPVYGRDLLAPELAQIPPTDSKFETSSVFDDQQRERARIVYGKGSLDPSVALCYFVPDPSEIEKSGNSFVSIHPDQGGVVAGGREAGLFANLILAKDRGFSFSGSISYNGVPRAIFGTDDMPLDPRKPNLINFNWDNYHVFDVQLNGQTVKSWCNRLEI